MAKWAPDAMLDAALDYVAAATVLHVCSGQPANYAGIAAVSLGSVAVDSGDFAKADGDSSGRKLTVAAQSGIEVASSGTASHVVLATTSGSVLRYVTTLASSQAVVAGNTMDVAAWKIELADPS